MTIILDLKKAIQRGTMAEENQAAPTKGVKIKNGDKRPAKRSTAAKRDLQSAKRAIVNSAHKARVHTAKRKLKEALDKKESKESLQPKLNLVFSLMDKAVKKGVIKKNKANRTKSRLAAKI